MKTSKNDKREYRARLAVLIGLSVIVMVFIGCSPQAPGGKGNLGDTEGKRENKHKIFST